jgi:hypothetical protein
MRRGIAVVCSFYWGSLEEHVIPKQAQHSEGQGVTEWLSETQ